MRWERAVMRAPEEKMTEVCIQWAALHKLEGDYLEFGVFQGNSFIRAHHFARLFNARLHAMRFYAFDSFRGLPAVEKGSVDDDPASIFHAGQYACTKDAFRNNLVRNGVDVGRIDIIPGWYRDTLTPVLRRQLPIKKAAVVWIDCDLYESTVTVLDFITPYMQDGTILMFDDWFAFKGRPDRGQPRAFTEWLAKNPRLRGLEYHRSEWAAMAFIIHVD
jgi:O-methyltransferase